MGNEDWRRRRAEELFGTGRGQLPRSGRESRFTSDDDVLPMAPIAEKREPRSATPFDHWAVSSYRTRPPAGAESPVPPPPAASRQAASRPVAPHSPPTAVTASAPSRGAAPLWALFAAVALIVAGAIGWLARGDLGTPVAAPAASVVLPAAPQPAVPLSTATAQPDTAAKAVEPQVAAPVPSASERRPAATRNRARSLPTDRSRNPAPVVTDRAKHASSLKGRAQSATGRGRERDRSTDSRALERQRVPVVAPTHRTAPTTRDRGDTTRAAGINCRRARNDVTAAICADAGLAALDRQLTSRFAALDRNADPATVQRIHRGETTFLNARQSCSDRECIAESYRQRLRELDPY